MSTKALIHSSIMRRRGRAYVAAIACLTRGCHSFAISSRTMIIETSTSTGAHRRPTVKGFKTNPGHFCLKAKKVGSTDEEKYTRVEDGSYIGVAIVGIGSLLLLNGAGDESSQFVLADDDVWIIFATASIAAGAARLYRYIRDKDD